MAPGLESYLIVFAVAAGVTLAATPVVRRISERWGLMVEPGARRVHERSTALLGGAAMFAGFLSAIGAAWALSDFDVVFATASEPVGIVIAALVMTACGTYDDVREMSAPAKVASMVLAGSILSFFGVTV
ncbi:MAG: undecaprenyl/decaprenyl-phosphate alpha-N-acetylglucosaminyl 1-phosphate transferase, partial [bacterium]|nr:undecaprenyl/decaprenyl-phosphate alpha-N-acetylglucosaminyl 1-phosphate transferase [bacterium]